MTEERKKRLVRFTTSEGSDHWAATYIWIDPETVVGMSQDNEGLWVYVFGRDKPFFLDRLKPAMVAEALGYKWPWEAIVA